MSAADVARWRANLQGEVDGISSYLAMAEAEPDAALATVYRRLADSERRHAAVWEAKLREARAWHGMPKPSWRARIIAAVARRFGAGVVAATIAGREAKDQAGYDEQPEAIGTSLPRDERSHARLLREIGGTGISGPGIARLEGRHRTGGNALRAAVLGHRRRPRFQLLPGDGRRRSVRRQPRDRARGNRRRTCGLPLDGARRMALCPERTRALLATDRDRSGGARRGAGRRRGGAHSHLPGEGRACGPGANDRAPDRRRRPAGGRRCALSRRARDRPERARGLRMVAAGTSFAMFGTGALVPLVAFAFLSGVTALVAAAVLSALALFAVGALITVITGQSAMRAGLRQLAIGVAAAAVTFGIGRLIGTAIS